MKKKLHLKFEETKNIVLQQQELGKKLDLKFKETKAILFDVK
jgi:hypothetical protein